MDSFIKEAKILAKFNDESGIVSVQDIFKENGTVYIVMYYVNGVTLEEYLTRNENKLPWEKVVQIMSIIMESLKKVHEAGVIHRDISPDNIYITTDNKVKLLDFGAARYFVANEKSTVSVVLKRGYAPLEQYYNKKENQGPWTDIYSIAATMYRAITGVKPPEALERMEEDELKSPGEMGVQIPYCIENAIMKGLSLKYADRPKTLNEFIGLLKPDERTEIIGDDRTVIIDRQSKPVAKKSKALILIGLLVVAISIPILLLLIKPGQADNSNESQGDTLAVVSDTEIPSSAPSGQATINPVRESVTPANSPAVNSVEPSTSAEQLEETTTPTATITPQPTLKMPDLRNKEMNESISILKSYELEYKLENDYSDTIAYGRVIKQSIQSGQEVKSDDVVILTISLGKKNSTASNIVLAPDLAGLTLYEATNKCLDIGMEMNVLREEYSNTVNVGLVISQVPEKGVQVNNGEIDVVMSKGKELQSVPTVTGMTEEEAKNTLSKAGLGCTVNYVQEQGTAGLVARQEPAAGSSVRKGDNVNIYVYKVSSNDVSSNADTYIAVEFTTGVIISGEIPTDGKTMKFFNVKID